MAGWRMRVPNRFAEAGSPGSSGLSNGHRGLRNVADDVAAREPQIVPARFHPHPGDIAVPRGRRGWVLRRLLAVSDIAALVSAYAVMVAALHIAGRTSVSLDLTLFVALLPLWPLLATLLKLYHMGDRSLDYSIADQIGPVVLVATVWNWGWLLARAVIGTGPVEVMPSIVLWTAMITLVLSYRFVVIMLSRSTRWYRQRVLMIGSPQDAQRVVRRISRHPEYGLEIVGTAVPPGFEGPVPLGNGDGGHMDVTVAEASEMAAMAEHVGANRVIIASVPESIGARSELIRDLVDRGLQVDLVSGDPDLCSSSAASLHFLEGLPVLTVPSVQVPRAWNAVKRTFDLAATIMGLVVLTPAMLAFAIGIRMGSPGPILFRQRRIGRNGQPFEVLKLRTMVDGADQLKPKLAALNMHARQSDERRMFKVPEDPRVTPFGAFLRRWSLDELPQLWNVLKGQMSLVGPRPLIPDEAEQVEGRYEVRMLMRPGITGPWQTLGRSDIGFEDMLKLDYAYVMNWTLTEDMKLLVKTVGAVAYAKGAY
jgi:exopolysaccharide biosynthesis polyprenyl glycosylphosphotransferase